MQILFYVVCLIGAVLWVYAQSQTLRKYFAEKRKHATNREFENAVAGNVSDVIARKYFDGEIKLEKTIYVVMPLAFEDEEVAERFFSPIAKQILTNELGQVDRCYRIDQSYGIDITLNDFVSGLELVVAILKENDAPEGTVIEYDDVELPLWLRS